MGSLYFENLVYEREDYIVTLTINRPNVRNALNRKTLSELHRAFFEFRHDSDARVMILVGAGDRAFVAGADIAEMQAMNQEEAEDFARLGQSLTANIESIPKAVIAAVNGFALGGGCELAMACDFILASDNAAFGQPEVGLGLIPGFGGTQRLARVVGRAIAKQMIFTGEIIKAQRALEIGLANAVYPLSELLVQAKHRQDHRQQGAARGRGRQAQLEPWLRPHARGRHGVRGDALRIDVQDRRHARRHARLPREAHRRLQGEMT